MHSEAEWGGMHGETGTDDGRGPGESPQVPPNVSYAQPVEQTSHGYDTQPGQAAPPDARHAPPASPNVYLPQADSAPAYDEYADPAAAHGWTSAYDETRELPAQAGPGEPTGAAEPTEPTGANEPAEPVGRSRTGEGRAARRRAERRTGGRRRVVAVAGALGVAGAVAVIAAVAGGSGSPASDGPGPDGGTHAVVGDSATASPRTDAGSSAASTATPGASSTSPSRSSAGASQGKASTGPTTSAPATTSATAGAPTPTATTADPPTSTSAFPSGRGHGHGATKRPR
ncbi:hypothetical protein ACIBJF_10575 [Streptomyces sp. NPDC050743]|uniref:hypothetical protein n=1 Tax=Streptomyces sp. NPDC050743 TaxID=3365634 RepID=UPI0037913F38